MISALRRAWRRWKVRKKEEHIPAGECLCLYPRRCGHKGVGLNRKGIFSCEWHGGKK